MTISGKKPKKNVNHGVNEKSGVELPFNYTQKLGEVKYILNPLVFP